ncbi:TetR/AcrR family transcriptional regulator [Litorivivens sp.]|uniref:TetR/AcrR family transcriptional regulator n=1 Tax=Litorivivens sp. TaxID=2020868 RepID=UPI00356A8829
MGQRTIERLIVSTEKLISQVGTSGLRLNSVVSDANVGNAAAVNYHFKNKAGLIQATIEYRIPQIMHHRSGVVAVLSETPRGDAFHYQLLLILFPIFEIIRTQLPESYYGRMLQRLDVTNPDMVKTLTDRTRDLDLGFRSIMENARLQLEYLVGERRCAELSMFIIGAAAQAIGEIERDLCAGIKAGKLPPERVTEIMDYSLFQLLTFLVNGALQNAFSLPEQDFHRILSESRQRNSDIDGTSEFGIQF